MCKSTRIQDQLMHGTVPLLRSVASAASHSPSKIPHLRFHIALRQSRTRQTKINKPHSAFTTQQRCQSTLVFPTDFEKTTDTSALTEDNTVKSTYRHDGASVDESVYEGPFLSAKQLSDTLEKTNTSDALEHGLPDRIVSALMSNEVGSPFIRQAGEDLFNKALFTLDPVYFIEPFKDLGRHLKGRQDTNVLHTKQLDHRLSTFAAYLDRIVALRREAGLKLGLDACNHLLKCAKSMGDAALARSVLEIIMPADGVEPNLESYNYYCQALVWSHGYSSIESYNLRVIPRHLKLRASRSPPKGLSGHVTSTRRKGVKGIREEVLDIFRLTVDKAHTTNELMFINIMLAMGREADLDGVKSILKSVWNIDLDLLSAYDEEEIESPTFYDTGHHLRPSEDLLFAVAHIFGSNNDIRTAWLLVDFISRNYDLRITQQVWLHLCEWAFVLSIRRSSAQRKRGRADGQITQQTFVQLVEAMTDEPHNIRPDAFVYFLLSRSWRDKKHLDKTISNVQQLGDIIDKQHSTMNDLAKQVLAFAWKIIDQGHVTTPNLVPFFDLRRKYTLEYLDFQKSLQMMRIAVNQNLLKETDWAGSGKLTGWERRRLPDLVQMFAAYLPNTLMYKTRTGVVELSTYTTRRDKIYHTHRMDYRILPRILNAMDTDDRVKLDRRMQALPYVVTKAKEYCFNCESTDHDHSQCPNNSFASSTPDHAEERNRHPRHSRNKDSDDDDSYILVLNPDISKEVVPYSFEPESEEERAKPHLPFP